MKQIKFRGKSIKSGEWVYGFYYEENRAWVDDLYNWGDYDAYDILSMIASPYGDHFKEHEVDKKTVGQFIGLKDKNGTEIYEGDIIKVYYHESALDIKNVKTSDVVIIRDIINAIRDMGYFETCEVIGNTTDGVDLKEE